MNRITRAPSMIALALASFLVGPALAQTPAGTAFTYQGQLTDAGSPATGSFDFQFQLFDAATGSNQIGTTLDRPGVAVNVGLFTASLDFGQSPFGGDARWLQILVRPAGGGAYTPIAPRTPLTPAPYAIVAERVVDGPYTFAGDPDTGVFHPAADTVAFAAGGTQVATITAAGLSASTTVVAGVALRGTASSGIGDGVLGVTGGVGRGVVAQNTAGGAALLAAGTTGDHLVAATSIAIPDPVLRVTNAGSVLAEGTLNAGNSVTGSPPATFNAFGNSANKDEASISAANDLYVEGGLEVDAAAFVENNVNVGGSVVVDGHVQAQTNGGQYADDTFGHLFRDNAVVAWGKVTGDPFNLVAGFGLCGVGRLEAGNYSVSLCSTFATQQTLTPFAQAEVDGPPVTAAAARFVTIDQEDPNTFRVYMTNGNFNLVDGQFVFIVTGR